MLTIEQIRAQLEDMNLKRVAERAGVGYSKVYRLVQPGSRPLYETAKAVSDYLESRARDDHTDNQS